MYKGGQGRVATSYHRINCEYFKDALDDEGSNLTYSALVGLRKQSVEDAERLGSLDPWLPSWIPSWRGTDRHYNEAKYINVINDWRRAWDERGLSESERSCFNCALLDYILDELIPWHKDICDYSTLEITRYTIINQ